MDRLPFDPGKMAKRESARPGGRSGALTVSQFAERMTDALRAGFPDAVRVLGEVSGFKPGTHWYFAIKDADAVVQCVMFANAARGSAFTPADGQSVVVTGKPDFWAKGGRASLIITKIEPVGEGALDAAFRAMCEEIRALGWFDPERKRPLPPIPRRVGVVTAKGGAAIHDVLDTMRRRCPMVEVALVDVQVQGQGAAESVAAAVRWLGRRHVELGVDVILVTRGGGSREDLWAFNERVVAEAIVKSPIPVVAAIGHETDTSIAELVADERCATPTQAAMRLTPDREALFEQLAAMSSALRTEVLRRLKGDRQKLDTARRHAALAVGASVHAAAARLETISGRIERHRPAAARARRTALLEATSARLVRAWASAVERASARLSAGERQLAAVGPMAVLKRGYSCTMRADGTLVRSAGEVKAGERVRTRVADGEFGSVVDASGSPARSSPTRRAKAGGNDPGLFGSAG